MTAAPAAPLHVLVIDDHEDSAHLLARLLRHEGHTVAVAHTLFSALALGTVVRPGLVICDIDLPDGDGCELLRRLRAFYGGRELSAVAVTGYGNEWVERCHQAGYARFFTKPVEFAALLEVAAALRPHEPRTPGGVPSPSVDPTS